MLTKGRTMMGMRCCRTWSSWLPGPAKRGFSLFCQNSAETPLAHNSRAASERIKCHEE